MAKNPTLTNSAFRIPLYTLFVSLIAIFSFQIGSLNNKSSLLTGEFHGEKVTAPIIANNTVSSDVLGDEANTNKRIEVDLSNQRVYAYDGGQKVYDFTVSTGLWGRTPTGTFTIQRKVRSQTMSGGNRAIGTYYYLPNVEWVQFFGNNQIPWSRGFSFHGTYWHNNFGHPMSHGCVNMKTPEAQALYDWAPMGTPVVIYGNTPA